MRSRHVPPEIRRWAETNIVETERVLGALSSRVEAFRAYRKGGGKQSRTTFLDALRAMYPNRVLEIRQDG